MVEIPQEDPGFRAGSAALNTVNSLGALLQGLLFHLHSMPENLRAFGKVQETLDRMIEVVTS
eukprot:3578411-Pyramimonas_sp.AAC.1